jgi:hypothetical protein
VEDTKGEIKIVHQRTDNTMAKRKSTKRNTTKEASNNLLI